MKNQEKIEKLNSKYINNFFITFMVMIFILVGAMLNMYVMMRNDGRMPVYHEDWRYNSNEHFTFSNYSEVNDPKLADIYKIRNSIYSQGDFMMMIGVVVLSLITINQILTMIDIRRLNKNG